MKLKHLVLWIILIALMDYSKRRRMVADAEVFTSSQDILRLLHLQNRMDDILNLLIQAEEEKISVLRKYVNYPGKLTGEAHSQTKEDDNMMDHPISGFRIVKHLTYDWENLRKFLSFDLLTAALHDVEKEQTAFQSPTGEDVQGAAVAISRLQQTYQISANDLALSQSRFNLSGITASECYLIGQQQAQAGKYSYALGWLEMALEKLQSKEESADSGDVQLIDVLDWLHWAYYNTGNNVRALQLTDAIIAINATHGHALSNRVFYQQYVDALSETEKTQQTIQPRPPPLLFQSSHDESLCRGEGNLASLKTDALCYYVTHNLPFLLIQPAKYERVYSDPEIYLIHDVARSAEMDFVKNYSGQFLKRAQVVKVGSTGSQNSYIRIAKTAFLDDYAHPVLRQLNDRIGLLTNLDMNRAEKLQVANYGIGGNYEPHFDFFRTPYDPHSKHVEPEFGDRIATLLLYLTDVPLGGATIFPRLNLTIFPQKGSAAFWYNLHQNGTGDLRTLHGGCPVLIGHKWVCNKWIREIGQHATRPCHLNKDK